MAPRGPSSKADPPLFRPEAIDAISGQGTLGRASIYQPAKLVALSGLIGCLVALGTAYLFLAEYPRRVTARGYILADDALSYLHATRDGIISEIMITEGEAVGVGQALMKLTFPSGLSSGPDLNHLVGSELDYRIDLLSEQLAGVEAEFDVRRDTLTAAIGGTLAEIEQLAKIEKARSHQLRLASSQYNALKRAHERGAVSPSTLLDAQKEIFDLRTAYLAGKQERLALGRTIAQYRNERRHTQLMRLNEVRQINLRMSDVREQHAHARFAAGMAIGAPVAGVVSGIQHRTGESVRHGDLLAVIDSGERRAGILHVPDGAAALVAEGATVSLIFEAYPVAKYGTWTGVIESLTNAPISVEHLEGPLAADGPAYVAKMRIQDRTEESSILRLLPGMIYTAHITLESRTIAEWLFDPLIEAFEVQMPGAIEP